MAKCNSTDAGGMPSVLVVGAHGFVGRHTARALASAGFKVLGLGHGAWMDDAPANWGIARWVEDDITISSLELIASETRPIGFVHCAGGASVSQSYLEPLGDYERSVVTTAQLLEFVRQCDWPTRVVLASSAAVYGDHGDVDLDEASHPEPLSPYGSNKLAAERLSHMFSLFFGIEVCVVRLFSVYGEGLRKQLLWDALRMFSKGECTFFGSGTERRDWIHVDDAARALSAALQTRVDGLRIFNCGHEQATVREVLQQLAGMVNFHRELMFTGEAHVGNPLRLTADWSRARSALGWQPAVSLSQGLRRYVEWYESVALP